ncbi:ketoacyl-ACP synthase III family protein [Streptomyces pini]|uniref:3-oxoacyl-[acyl-carrier-protein] synthase-3 n=1 Tax=Streptomyces pini TaxID=1520580 RepID=A0A1I4L1Q3_9ACTN|nr:ketoacyl-ACP synthase III family protein [Streptomyces pini]SFL84587.1 3-oxoacyl-[acyl-carrier-protein] synthase-3 [Streptomyces pini]
MRWNDLYIAGVGSYLPEQVETADEAIAAGRYTSKKKAVNGYRAVRVAAPGEIGPMMAAKAGRQAVERSGHDPEEFGLVLHSYLGHPGLDMWTPASYVQRETVGGSGPAYEIKQGCNGMLAALELGGSFVTGRPDVTAALVTAGDAFRMPYIDRWGTDEQTVEGDGAAAFVLSSRGGFARVRSTFSIGDSSLESMGRSGAAWTDVPFPGGETIRVSARKRDYLLAEDLELDGAIEKIAGNVKYSLEHALKEAEVESADIRFFLHQHIAESIATHAIYGLLGVDRATSTFDWGLDLGMVGTADPVLGLDHVIATRSPRPGDIAVLQGAGAGYVWSVAVLEFLETPHWAA